MSTSIYEPIAQEKGEVDGEGGRGNPLPASEVENY